PTAMMVAAAVMLALVVPAVLILVGKPPHLSHAAVAAAARASSATQIRAHALRDIGFLSVAVAFALVLFAQVGFIVHLISFLDPVIGRASATTALALLINFRNDCADRGLRRVRLLCRQSDHAAVADRAAGIRPAIVRRAGQPADRHRASDLCVRPRRGRRAARSLGELHAAVLLLY